MFIITGQNLIVYTIKIIYVLGISPVDHLNLDFTSNPSWLTWSPPSFYSNDIPQWSITTYNVIVVNQYGSVIVDDNTTDTFYQLPSNYIEYCDIYTASVTANIEQYSSSGIIIAKQNTGGKIILYLSI